MKSKFFNLHSLLKLLQKVNVFIVFTPWHPFSLNADAPVRETYFDGLRLIFVPWHRQMYVLNIWTALTIFVKFTVAQEVKSQFQENHCANKSVIISWKKIWVCDHLKVVSMSSTITGN